MGHVGQVVLRSIHWAVSDVVESRGKPRSPPCVAIDWIASLSHIVPEQSGAVVANKIADCDEVVGLRYDRGI